MPGGRRWATGGPREHAFYNLGLWGVHQNDLEAAQRYFATGLEIARELSDVGCAQSCLFHLGNVAFQQGDLAAARAHFDEILALARKQEDPDGISTAFHWLGRLALAEGDVETARALGEESLQIARKLPDEGKLAAVLCSLGDAVVGHGDLEGAGSHYRESLQLYRKMPAPAVVLRKFGPERGIARCLEGMAKIVAAKDRREQAVRLLAAAEALRQTIDAPRSVPETVECEHLVALLRKAQGEPAFATAWAEGMALPLEEAMKSALEGSDPA